MGRPRKREIYVGMVHNHLTVTRELERDRFSIATYECRCECGGTVRMRTNHFVPQRRFCTRSCALLQQHRIPHLLGKHFGRWTVQEFAGIDDGRGYWKCVCECGSVGTVNTTALLLSQSLSCGCLTLDIITKEYTAEERLSLRRERCRNANKRNPARVMAEKIKYMSKKERATPSWLTKEDWDAMNAIYEEARRLTIETGIEHQVDHIYPINGKTVSGLHVPLNLQILTKAQNVAKSNRYAEHSGD